MVKADRDVLMSNLVVGVKLDPPESRGILLLNLMRVRLGIGALAIDLRLCAAAQGHSQDMSEKKFFDHMSPVPGRGSLEAGRPCRDNRQRREHLHGKR